MKTMRNLLGHDREVAALPERTEGWFTGLDSILTGEARGSQKQAITKENVTVSLHIKKPF